MYTLLPGKPSSIELIDQCVLAGYTMRSLRYCIMRLFFIMSIILVSLSASIFSEESNSEQDRMALLALRDGFISGGTPPDGSALSSWNSSLHFCEWQGVTCGKKHKRVTGIWLSEQKLDGVLPPSIGNLTFLRVLHLSSSSLHGEVPKEIGQLWRLQYLHLGGNFFQGGIPIELSNCSSLQKMSIANNNFSGLIPSQFGSLSKLTALFAGGNNLAGEMPSFLGNLSSLIKLDLGTNHFHGEIHNSLQGLSNLTILLLMSNHFSGSISPLYNLSSLERLDISINHFTGTLAQDMDVAFPRATFLSLWNNNFTGAIPSSLSNISGLTDIQIGENDLTGRVPDNLGKLKYLNFLEFRSNHLGSEESNDLNFLDSLTNCTELNYLDISDNRFGGQLPNSIANFTLHLQKLVLVSNYITGTIPEGLGELSGLSVIDFGFNLFDGVIPNSIGKLGNLSRLFLYENKLRGGIPSSIGNLTKLTVLHLARNSLNGNIPSTLRNWTGMEAIDISGNHLDGNLPKDLFIQFQHLWYCNISRNSFDGIFPLGVGKVGVLNALSMSYNNFYGQIPTDLGQAVQLEYLDMAGNSFEGSIPTSLGRLRSLIALDLSNNNLSGPIPKDLASITRLQYFNLSLNKLEGEVPFFKHVSEFSVVGNIALCGGNPELHLQPCEHHLKKRKILSRKGVIAISLSALASFSLSVIVYIFFSNRRIHKKGDVNSLAERYKRVTYTQLFKATDGFAESNLIGTGSFGDVYKAVILHQNERKPVAVKVLKLSKHRATESFTAECKILRRIRHRNLLSVITSCSSLDNKGNDFKALVFEFMSNGTLDNWLHSVDSHQLLTFAKRLEIAIDVGCALDYLHNGCETPIVHCDLKPSNILLDDDMVAHVGDFGLAKLLLGDLGGGESMSTALRGSIGYIAPEYGMSAAVSPQGDIYSYGIRLLELITGRRPTDDIFNDEMSLRSFCERGVPDHVEEIVHQSLLGELHEVTLTRRNPEETKLQFLAFLISLVELGISCAAESPRHRMDIQSAIQSLKRIKEKSDSIVA
uniref:non-specific serine/threonine protein kinase n=1 Tax=Kalanchoe fedtschenkoi TaxID=63787 RepID=A0A7N0T6D6_KALFE